MTIVLETHGWHEIWGAELGNHQDWSFAFMPEGRHIVTACCVLRAASGGCQSRPLLSPLFPRADRREEDPNRPSQRSSIRLMASPRSDWSDRELDRGSRNNILYPVERRGGFHTVPVARQGPAWSPRSAAMVPAHAWIVTAAAGGARLFRFDEQTQAL